MNTRQISFAIQGMSCAKCAVAIERALTRLDGVVAAHVNFASERASVVFDPTYVSALAMINVVRGEGFDVSLTRVILSVNDLLYATSARTVEHVLSHLDGVAYVQTDLGAQQIVLDVFAESVHRRDYERALANLGLRVVEHTSANAGREFGVRAVAVTGLALLSLWSAGAHAGWFAADFIHAPLVVIAISLLVAYIIGWRFYRLAFDACLDGKFDYSVVIALVASVSLLGGLLFAMLAPTNRFASSGFVFATLLTAGWFLARGGTVWASRVPRLNHTATNNPRVAQPQLGVIPHGSRR